MSLDKTKQIIDRETQVIFLRLLVARMVSRKGVTPALGRSLLVTTTELDSFADRIAKGDDSLYAS